MESTLQSALQEFLITIDFDELTKDFSESEKELARQTLNTFKGEAVTTLSIIEEHLNFNIRILEVGAGLCLVSLFLKDQGYNIVALEPLAGGFGFFEKLKTKILNLNTGKKLTTYDITAQELSSETHGQFGLIYSNNVIEHITEVKSAFKAMRRVLSNTGKMIHGCPNYIVPYEPHFGIPVIASAPWLTEKMLKNKIKQKKEVWDSLNFITYFQVKSLANENGCTVTFKKELTYNAFMRLQNDYEFIARHKNTFVGKLFKLMQVTHTLRLTKYIPAFASTPMVFIMSIKVQAINSD